MFCGGDGVVNSIGGAVKVVHVNLYTKWGLVHSPICIMVCLGLSFSITSLWRHHNYVIVTSTMPMTYQIWYWTNMQSRRQCVQVNYHMSQLEIELGGGVQKGNIRVGGDRCVGGTWVQTHCGSIRWSRKWDTIKRKKKRESEYSMHNKSVIYKDYII